MGNNVNYAILEEINNRPNESFKIKRDILPHIEVPLHYHPFYEFSYVKESFGTKIVGDHISPFKEADLVLIGPNLPHCWKNDETYYSGDPQLKVDVYILHFAENIFNEHLFNIPELEEIHQILAASRQGILITGKTNRKITRLITKLFMASGIDRILLFLEIFKAMLESNELTSLSSPEFARFFCEKESGRLQKVYEHISKNFNRNITIEEISNIACLSPAGFSRHFKQQTGLNFTTFLNNFRVGYAKNLLNKGANSISETAHQCGFQDISYFHRVFKHNTGQTPKDYIRSITNNELQNILPG